MVSARHSVVPWVQDRLFHWACQRRLVYNTCWEDPRVDRPLLELRPDSRLVMLTSAGCNALTYLLDAPESIHCVDINARQNALLELKMKLIERGHYEDFYQMFGQGAHPRFRGLLEEVLPRLSDPAREFWRRRTRWFDPAVGRRSFFYHGTAGLVAWIACRVLRLSGLHMPAARLFAAATLDEQRALFARIEASQAYRFFCWLMQHPFSAALVGVPNHQLHMARKGTGDTARENLSTMIKRAATRAPLRDNYFGYVYFHGRYSETCLPDYLRREHFDKLRQRLGAICPHTCSLTGFLRRNPGAYTHFNLLDHQDWMACRDHEGLRVEWRAILDNSAPGARVLMRTAGEALDFLPDFVAGRVEFHPERTRPLLFQDRPSTYGGLHLGIVRP